MGNDIFISYEVNDYESLCLTKSIAEAFDKEDISCYDFLSSSIRDRLDGIKNCKAIVMIYTRATNLSERVLSDIDTAFSYKKTIIPFVVDPTPMNEELSYYVNRKHWLIAFPDFQANIAKLIDTINAILGRIDKNIPKLLIKIQTDLPCKVYIDDKFCGYISTNQIFKFPLSMGVHNMRFTAIETRFFEIEYAPYHVDTQEQLIHLDFASLRSKALSEKETRLKLLASKYDRLSPMKNGCIMLKKGDKYGFANIYGFEITDTIFDDAYDFTSDGLAPIRIGNQFGVINRDGEMVVALDCYAAMCWIHKGVITTRKFGIESYFDINGNPIFEEINDISNPENEGIFRIYQNGKIGFIDGQGVRITSPIYDHAEMFKNGRANIVLCGKKGYIDSHGGEFFDTIYDEPFVFENGYAVVKRNGKFGVINSKAEEFITPQYDYIGKFNDQGLISVKSNGYINFIDSDGLKYFTTDIPLSLYKDGLKAVDFPTYKCFINEDGEVIILSTFNHVDDFSEGLARFMIEDANNKQLWGFIDKTGSVVIEPIYDAVSDFDDGYAPVIINHKWGLIDKQGTQIIPCIYKQTISLSEELANVKIDKYWGFVDIENQIVIPAIYQAAWSFTEGLAAVKLREKWGFIDRNGTMKISPLYDFAGAFYGDRALVKKGQFWGFIDKQGNEVIPVSYDRAYAFSNGLAAVESKGQWGYINKFGNIIIPQIYSQANMFTDGKAVVLFENEYFYIDTCGNRIL